MRDNQCLRGRNYRYIHIFQGSEAYFPSLCIDLICNPKNGFCPDEHLFATPVKELYDALRGYPNVCFIPVDNGAKAINVCAPHCDWVIVHGFWSPLEEVRIHRVFWKKIIWRTWGHDVLPLELRKGSYLKNGVKRLLNRYRVSAVRNFAAIGVANAVDEINLQDYFGSGLPTVRMSYPIYENSEIFFKLLHQETPEKEKQVNVMIGHCGGSANNHIEIMERLLKYRDENIRLYLPMNYGDTEYISRVKQRAQELWGNKAETLTEKYSYEEYVKLLNQMNIAIFDGTGSYALGNIYILLGLHKKLFLNRAGVLKRAFDSEQLPYRCTDEISSLEFEDFSRPVCFPEGAGESMMPITYDQEVESWKKLFASLK